jgi:hypothetical protein
MTLNIVLFYPKGEQDEKDEEKNEWQSLRLIAPKYLDHMLKKL